jgi:transcription elongation factor Elf1
MQRYKIDFKPEICCEYCNDIIHNHFDCPICNKHFASTSIYGEYWEETEFSCEECKAKFKLVDKENNLWEKV